MSIRFNGSWTTLWLKSQGKPKDPSPLSGRRYVENPAYVFGNCSPPKTPKCCCFETTKKGTPPSTRERLNPKNGGCALGLPSKQPNKGTLKRKSQATYWPYGHRLPHVFNGCSRGHKCTRGHKRSPREPGNKRTRVRPNGSVHVQGNPETSEPV